MGGFERLDVSLASRSPLGRPFRAILGGGGAPLEMAPKPARALNRNRARAVDSGVLRSASVGFHGK